MAALHDDAGRRHVGDLDGVVLADARIASDEVLADLLGVDVERRDELDVPDVVVAELHVHQAGHADRRIGVLVVLDALDQRRGAVADADDGDAYRTHRDSFSRRRSAGCRWVDVALAVDQLVEPAHLALDRLEAVPLQLEGVAVEPLAGASERGAQAVAALLQAAAPPLEDAQPGVRLGAAEEREVHAEVLVLPGGRSGVGRAAPGSAPCRRR